MRSPASVCGVLMLAVAGCAVGKVAGGSSQLVRPAHFEEPMLTCADAARAARGALLRMGYGIAEMKAPKPDVPGLVVGTRETGWSPYSPEAAKTHSVSVTIKCSDAGSAFDAVSDEGFFSQLNFPNQFASALKEQIGRHEVRPRISDEEPQGLVIKVEPKRPSEALAELGIDLPSAGVTPVKVEIINRTDRRYSFRRSEVELVTQEGDAERALSLKAAADRVGPVRTATPVESLLQQKEIHDGEIAPGATLSGYLYFNASTYSRARVVLTDVDSDEPEGFSVTF